VSKLSLKRILTEVSIEKVDGADVSNTEAVAGSSSKGSALMAGLLGALRAYHLWFHAAHNLTKGTGFAGDHTSLYGKIYVESLETLDAAIERGVGVFDNEELGCPNMLTQLALQVLNGWVSPANRSEGEIAKDALEYSLEMCALVDGIAKSLDSLGALTYGLDDFLASICSSHEEYVYLLRQRVKK